MESKVSNYEKACIQWQEKFLQWDLEELQKKVPELKEEGEYLTLYHYARKYGIHKKKGTIEALEDSDPVSNTTKFNIYTLLGFATPGAALTNDWVPFEQLKNARPFGPAFQRGVIRAFALTFAGHGKELEEACIRLKGQKLRYADVGYQLDAFACMPLRFLFWEEDEEFDAQANILYDRSATDFIHVESTVSVASEGLYRLAQAAGIPVKGSTFQL